MKPAYFGDSYDIVKRFFCFELSTLGYSVAVEPMFTESMDEAAAFFTFIGAGLNGSVPVESARSAVLFDPDTGVRQKPGAKHLSLKQLAAAAAVHSLVFAFDQAFSRAHDHDVAMRDKLRVLREMGCHGMYYDSHARFLFAAATESPIDELRTHLVQLGMPARRLMVSGI